MNGKRTQLDGDWVEMRMVQHDENYPCVNIDDNTPYLYSDQGLRRLCASMFMFLIPAFFRFFCRMAVGLLVMVNAAHADIDVHPNGLRLAQTNNCLGCHRVDRKIVGPAFMAIADRFAGQEAALDYLADRIRQGSRGRWGPVPMPRQVQVSPEEAEALAAWILSLTIETASKAVHDSGD